MKTTVARLIIFRISPGCPHSNRFDHRLSEAEACYTGALRAGQPPPDLQQRCHLRLALCTVNAAEGARKARARGGGGGSQLSSAREQQQREEAECFAGLLLDEEGGCSEAVDETVRAAHSTVGVFRLCEEWDVTGALHHFSMATANGRREGGPLQEEEEEEDRRVPQGGGVGWGAVWLAQVGALKIALGPARAETDSVFYLHLDWCQLASFAVANCDPYC